MPLFPQSISVNIVIEIPELINRIHNLDSITMTRTIHASSLLRQNGSVLRMLFDKGMILAINLQSLLRTKRNNIGRRGRSIRSFARSMLQRPLHEM